MKKAKASNPSSTKSKSSVLSVPVPKGGPRLTAPRLPAVPVKGRRPVVAPTLKKKVPHMGASSLGPGFPGQSGRPGQQRVKALVTGSANGSTAGLSDCAFNYAKALCNPWGTFDELPCVPSAPPMETQRWRAITRGTFGTPTSGAGAALGFIMIQPQNPTSDALTVVSTPVGNAFLGANFTRAAAGVSSTGRAGLAHVVADFNAVQNFLSARLVGLSLRVRNYTNALNVGGILTACRLNNGESLESYTLSSLQQSPLCKLQPVTLDANDWKTIVWAPTTNDDVDFPDGNINFAIGAGGHYDAFSIGFAVQAASNALAQSYEFELIEFWEYTGARSGVQLPEVLETHADTVGLDRALQGIAGMPDSLSLDDIVATSATDIVESIAHSDSVSKTVEDLVGMAGMALKPAGGLIKSLLGALML